MEGQLASRVSTVPTVVTNLKNVVLLDFKIQVAMVSGALNVLKCRERGRVLLYMHITVPERASR
jgi:hypothetical protein